MIMYLQIKQSTQQVQNQPKNTSATQNSNTQNNQPTTVQDQNAQLIQKTILHNQLSFQNH